MSEQLDSILLWFESGDVDIDQALDKYRQATELIEQMEEYLKTAQNKIHKIQAVKTK